MEKTRQDAANAHTPTTLMALFANAFKLERDQDILWLKGVYRDIHSVGAGSSASAVARRGKRPE